MRKTNNYKEILRASENNENSILMICDPSTAPDYMKALKSEGDFKCISMEYDISMGGIMIVFKDSKKSKGLNNSNIRFKFSPKTSTILIASAVIFILFTGFVLLSIDYSVDIEPQELIWVGNSRLPVDAFITTEKYGDVYRVTVEDRNSHFTAYLTVEDIDEFTRVYKEALDLRRITE